MEQYLVYVVDDDEDDREFLREALQIIPCVKEVKLFTSVEALLQSFAAALHVLPNLIVLDHQAPGISGSEAVAALRADKRFDAVALAVYSSHITPLKKEELLQKGADACFGKGTSVQEIREHAKLFCAAAEKRSKSFPR